MTDQEKAVLRQIAETEKRIVAQQERIARLKAERQPVDMAEGLLSALQDTLQARRTALDAIRHLVKIRDSSN
jgi:hypothetical protein